MLTLSQFFHSCSTLPGTLQSYESVEDFTRQFQQLFSSQEAKEASNVLYAFVCEKKIPRIKSESNILYIGKTEQRLCDRYLGYVKYFCLPCNVAFYRYVIARYGPIKILYFHTESPQQAETELLSDYFELHKELPPKNFQSGTMERWLNERGEGRVKQ